MCHHFLGMKIKNSENESIIGMKESRGEHSTDRKCSNVCTKVSFELGQTSLISTKETVQQVT